MKGVAWDAGLVSLPSFRAMDGILTKRIDVEEK